MLAAGRLLTLVLLCQRGLGVKAGIAGFHKWFVEAFPSAVSDSSHPRQQETFDHVCIDMNQILHVALRRAVDENHAIRRIYKEVNLTLKRCSPRRSVVFAFDGSAPLAKLLVQRRRRESSKRNSKYTMSALHLSPGTKFMEDVAVAMEYYAFQECTRPCYERVKFYISGANVPGEGELKCIDWLKLSLQKGSEEDAVIVGGDADLILQGLALPEVKNLFVCSQADTGSFRLSSLWEVIRSLEMLFPGQSDCVRIDLAVLIMLNGNDYLPKVRGVSFDRCFRSYTKLKHGKHKDTNLIDGKSRSLCWEFLEDLLADMLPDITEEAKGYPAVSLEQMDINNRYPPAGSILNLAVQQGKLGDGVEVNVHELSNSEEAGSSAGGMRKWRSSTWVRGKEYTWVHTAPKKQTVRHEAAAKLLEELLPDIFDKFMEQEKARLQEQMALDKENEGIEPSCNPDDDAEDNARSSRAKKKPLFDVEEYLSGVLWNLQMYVDGYVPNYYWHYSPRYSPSVADILFWIQNNGALLAKVSPPVTQAPPLPAAIACLCMLPMTQSGRAFLPQRLQPLVKINSPLLEALEWRGATSGLDIPKILRFIQEKAPDELRDFHDGSHSSFKVVFLDLSARQGEPIPPPPPSKEFPPLEKSRRSSTYRFKRIQVKSFSCTSEPRNLPWGRPSETPGILDQPYKRAFVDENGAKVRGGGRGGRGRGGSRAGRGGRKSPKSVAWRRETNAPRIRQGGGTGRGQGAQRAAGSLIGGAPPDPLLRAAADEGENGRRSPFPSSARPDTGSSMCFGSTSTGRSPQCRLLL